LLADRKSFAPGEREEKVMRDIPLQRYLLSRHSGEP